MSNGTFSCSVSGSCSVSLSASPVAGVVVRFVSLCCSTKFLMKEVNSCVLLTVTMPLVNRLDVVSVGGVVVSLNTAPSLAYLLTGSKGVASEKMTIRSSYLASCSVLPGIGLA